eukprot:Nitzschia sp. Nitz4//scaffold182_size44100//5925//8284//NITZ4_007246-RA/size44100-snap-gene-0.0-mRNA-1//1//CDS//3329539541//302//frame0
MAARSMEDAQRALRPGNDYDSEDEEERMIEDVTPLSMDEDDDTPIVSSTGSSQEDDASSFDPYSPTRPPIRPTSTVATEREYSLADDASVMPDVENHRQPLPVPGGAGYLEMEHVPPRDYEPIQTSSGLMLTHRRAAVAPSVRSEPQHPRINTVFDKSDPLKRPAGSGPRDAFELDFGWNTPPRRRHSMAGLQARRMLSYVQIWMIASAFLLMFATVVLFHALGSHSSPTQEQSQPPLAESILLVPMEGISDLQNIQLDNPERQRNLYGMAQPEPLQATQHHTNHNQHQHTHSSLLEEFEAWVTHHGKNYHSHDEKQHRFNIWTQNHHRTAEKNRRHGKCKMTNQHVFGSNQFQDLSPQEFQAKYLTGYKPPELSSKPKPLKSTPRTLKPGLHNVNLHESIHHKRLQQQPLLNLRNPNCMWFDVSCYLRWVWNAAGVQFGSIIGTMEPKYDSDAYPNSVDWRNYGVVTEVRSQGDCGACWAITAVETVESAHAMATGTLYDLSETEIIVCDDSCEMCSGGWPQNAFEWVMEHGGLPLYNSLPYDAYTLLALTQGVEGTSYQYTSDYVEAYQGQVCPANGGSGDNKNSGSHDSGDENANQNYNSYSSQARYGNIKGYGYATDRCVCYSDGSGCTCDDQDEELAIGNLATYGPAVVCVEASLWQDYTGGIMTSALGCGSEFMDMNHCVQVVGYAFTDGSEQNDGGQEQGSGDNGGSGDGNGGGNREGYWIVRNQWGGYWGYNGYAYVAMGDNTCGILNDMTQAYL